MKALLCSMLIILAPSLRLAAADWAPIAPEVWSLKEDPGQGVRGGIVLDERMTFTGSSIKHSTRIRILSEGGKAALGFPRFLPEASGIEGRTVQRDGTVVTFDKVKDFTQKTSRDGASGREVKILIPPGVTADCVVDLRWEDLAWSGQERPIPESLGYSATWRLASPYLTRQLVVEFWPQFHWNASVEPGTCAAPKVVREGRLYSYRFKDLPGEEPSPYTLDALSGRPVVRVWMQPDSLSNAANGPAEGYWSEAVRLWLRPTYHDNLKKGGAYPALAKELTKDLPADPAQAAAQLCMRLDRRILNQSWPTLEESGRFKKNQAFDKIDPFDLGESAKEGRTSGLGMALLFAALLEEAGQHPKYGLACRRDENLMRYQLKNVYQVDYLLIGVPLGGTGGTLWFDLSMRFAAPGLVHPEFQGVDSLVMDTATWKLRPEVVATQPAAYNRSSYQYRLTLGEDEEAISLKAGFSGYPELLERRRYMAMAPAEANRSLKERMEETLPNVSITRATVASALDPDQNVHYEVQARLERGDGTLHLNPFPGMPAPLWIPKTWPARRSVPILMDYLRIQDAECDFALPEGYAFHPAPPFLRENAFGKVAFAAVLKTEGGASSVHVSFSVLLNRLVAPASAEGDLRSFLDWVSEACRTTLTLEKL